MNKVFFISDLHLGHKQILKFSPQRGGTTLDEHNQWIIDQWNSVVTKRDSVWVLGDVAFGEDALKLLSKLRGQKHLVRGNHDRQSTVAYLEYFNNVYGIIKKYGVWMSHAPIHPQELRGKINVHGHVHHKPIFDGLGQPDLRYLSVCVEALNGVPISLAALLDEVKQRETKIKQLNPEFFDFRNEEN